jgi:hypothetical protein
MVAAKRESWGRERHFHFHRHHSMPQLSTMQRVVCNEALGRILQFMMLPVNDMFVERMLRMN